MDDPRISQNIFLHRPCFFPFSHVLFYFTVKEKKGEKMLFHFNRRGSAECYAEQRQLHKIRTKWELKCQRGCQEADHVSS